MGVVGAILLGGLAAVAWRFRRRNRRPAEDDDDLMGGAPGSAGREKTSNGSDSSPFKSTLEQYHNPNGMVNTASNF